MTKTFCDVCGQDITRKDYYIVDMYATALFDTSIGKYHMCLTCRTKIEKFIAGMNGDKK